MVIEIISIPHINTVFKNNIQRAFHSPPHWICPIGLERGRAGVIDSIFQVRKLR